MNFKDQVNYIKNNRKIDGHKFDKVTDITKVIDLLNSERENDIESKSNKDIESISRFVIRNLTQKIFIPKIK